MKVLQTTTFRKTVKRLHRNQKIDLDDATKYIIENPGTGEQKVGNLKGVYIHKFRMVGQITLLAYEYDEELSIIYLLALGSHENLYRDLS